MPQLRLALAQTNPCLGDFSQNVLHIVNVTSQAFAAGADIKQMAGKTAIDMLNVDQFSTWDQIRKTKNSRCHNASMRECIFTLNQLLLLN